MLENDAINLSDLLDRPQNIVNNAHELNSFYKNQIVLITGAGGSIGSELSKQIYNYQPKKLILLDIYENSVYDLQMYFEHLSKSVNNNVVVHVVIGSVYNKHRMVSVFETYTPTMVFHAAAYKHVPLMEDNGVEAVRTNLIGTYNIFELSKKYKVGHVLLVSSDKAVRPTNIMGLTKHYAELMMRYFQYSTNDTTYNAVRFGNVINSNGSVIPLFMKQIKNGGPVTVTHPEITRYFMTIPEAVSLILESLLYGVGGDIFILDMGKPIKILDLAKLMIEKYSTKPIEIKFIGLRPGEKLFEELLIDKYAFKTFHDRIFLDTSEVDLFKSNVIDIIQSFNACNEDVIQEIAKQLFLELNQ